MIASLGLRRHGSIAAQRRSRIRRSMIIPAPADLAGRYRISNGSRFRLKDIDPADPWGKRLKPIADRDAEAELQAHGGAAGAPLRAGSLVGAADLPGDGRRRQGRHHQARDVRRQPAGLRRPLVQGAVDRRARSRFPVAHQPPPAAPRPHRHLQSLVLRGDAGRPRAPEHPGAGSSCRRSWSPRTSGASASRTSTPTSATCRARACWSGSSSCTSRRTNSASASSSGSTSPRSTGSSRPADVGERAHFAAYMAAYEDMIRHTATDAAPWYVVPADRKWFTRLVVSAAIIDAIQSLDPRFPEVDPKVRAEFKRLEGRARGRGASGQGRRPRRPRRSEALLVAGRGRALRPLSRRGMGPAGHRRSAAVRKNLPRRLSVGPELDHDPSQARELPQGLQGLRSRRRRALRRARRAAAAEGRRHRPASRQDRIDHQQRETRARADRGAGIAGRLLLVVGAGGVDAGRRGSRTRRS